MYEEATDEQIGHLHITDLEDLWPILSTEEKIEGFRVVPRYEAEEWFLSRPTRDQAELLLGLPETERRTWIRFLPPDDVADILQLVEKEERDQLHSHLDGPTSKEVNALLAYAEDNAGGLMNPRYARVRPEMTTDEAISYLKIQTREHIESAYYIYVLDEGQHLLGVISFRELFSGKPGQKVQDIMRTNVIKALDSMDQEALSQLFKKHKLFAIPVVDDQNVIKGIVTLDDIVDVVTEEATEDIQKLGGSAALDAPYLSVGFFELIKKRAGWLSILFVGEMLTATAMSYFEDELASAIVLALFVPLIISSGGNSGSQATTLVIRAMALGEVKLRDWWRIINRELFAGLVLGSILGAIGFIRILIWQAAFHSYGDHALLIATTVFVSLVGVVTFGTMAGSGLPLLLRRMGFDPASASAPFVATLVDVTGLLIYFSAAAIILGGTLL